MWTRIRTFLPAVLVAAFAAFGLVTAGGVAAADDTSLARAGSTDACDWSSSPND